MRQNVLRCGLYLLLWVGWVAGLARPLPAQAVTAREPCATYASPHLRFGFNVNSDGGQTPETFAVDTLHAAWYLDYRVRAQPARPADLTFTQLVRASLWQGASFTQTLTTAVAANPGALWLVGNEPDRAGQDNLTPAQYARFYGETYRLIKTQDSTAQVAAGGLVQATPLRLRYLDMVLAEYAQRFGRPLPADLWHVHGFILPENYVWGAAIPPGLEDFAGEGMQYTVHDHDDLTIFQAHIRAFRQWMADHGYRNKPLIVSEYGILLSPLHGFPYEAVRTFMLGTFDFFLTATDETLGLAADEGRLVQQWSWFSLNDFPWDPETGIGFNGNLFNPETLQIEPLGQDFGNYIAPLVQRNVDLAVSAINFAPSYVVAGASTPITITLTVLNGGSVAANGGLVRLWLGDPDDDGVLIAEQALSEPVARGCRPLRVTLPPWTTPALDVGEHPIYAEVTTTLTGADDPPERDPANNRTVRALFVVSQPLTTSVYLPTIGGNVD
jgi:hypothetical protein